MTRFKRFEGKLLYKIILKKTILFNTIKSIIKIL